MSKYIEVIKVRKDVLKQIEKRTRGRKTPNYIFEMRKNIYVQDDFSDEETIPDHSSSREEGEDFSDAETIPYRSPVREEEEEKDFSDWKFEIKNYFKI